MLDSALPSAVGQHVPDYELLRRIGAGAYGEVWLARSKATGALRAAKTVWRSRFQDERPYQREFQGIQRFEKISREHPSQLALFHIGRNDSEGYFYYVMELADSVPAGNDARRIEPAGSGVRSKELQSPEPGSLSSSGGEGKGEEAMSRFRSPGSLTSAPSNRTQARPERSEPPDVESYHPHTLRADLAKGRLPAARVVEIGLALSEALAHLHKNGLVHRDVKPSNVIFVNGRPKLADIGLVTDASDQCSIVGTEGYLPPEGPGTQQADIFALGKVLYETVTGMDRREYPKLPEHLRDWPDRTGIIELNEILLRACAQNPERRYQTCDEIQADLKLLGEGKSAKQRRTREQLWTAGQRAAVLAALIGFGVVAHLVWQQRQSRSEPTKSQARALYEKARSEARADTVEASLKAYVDLTEATKLDPEFLDAHYMKFELNWDKGYIGPPRYYLPPHSNFRQNLSELLQTLKSLDSNSAEYHTVNSWAKYQDWKFDEAIAEASRAIEVNTNFLRAHGLYAHYMLVSRGDTETALREYRIAEQLDTNDVSIQSALSEVFYAQHDFTNAIKQLTKAKGPQPSSEQLYQLARAYEGAQLYNQAIDEHEANALQFVGGGSTPEKIKNWWKRMHEQVRTNGVAGWWRAQVEEDRSSRTTPYWRARFCARLGQTNEALSFLEQAYTYHQHDLTDLLIDECWDPLHGHPRYQALVTKMGMHQKAAQ